MIIWMYEGIITCAINVAHYPEPLEDSAYVVNRALFRNPNYTAIVGKYNAPYILAHGVLYCTHLVSSAHSMDMAFLVGISHGWPFSLSGFHI